MKHVRVAIPGKVMLAGEYSVLRGGHALAASINRWMKVSVTYDPKTVGWTVYSNIWDAPRIIKDLQIPQTDILMKAVQQSAKRHQLQGGEVRVHSDIQVADGVGSSSAVRLGVCSAFQLIKQDRDPRRASGISTHGMEQAWSLQSEQQGMASGYDIATQYAGGLVEFSYQYENNTWIPHWFRHSLEALPELVHVFVGGMGAPTTETMQSTASWLEGGHRAERLVEVSENLVDSFLAAIRWPATANQRKLFDCISVHRALFAGNPNFPVAVAEKLLTVPGIDTEWTWKTTGAGGEDAILLIGSAAAIRPAALALQESGWQQLNETFTTKGISIEELTTTELSPVRSGAQTRSTSSRGINR